MSVPTNLLAFLVLQNLVEEITKIFLQTQTSNSSYFHVKIINCLTIDKSITVLIYFITLFQVEHLYTKKQYGFQIHTLKIKHT